MIIGVDIDNVLSKFNEKLLEEYILHDEEIGGRGIVDAEAKYIRRGMFSWSEEEENHFYYSNIERIASLLEVVEEAALYIDKLKQLGVQIYIITGRDNGEYSRPYELTVEWLKKHNINYDKLFLTNAYNYHEKTEVCIQNGIKIMIDDSLKVCFDVKKYGITSLLMDTPYNRNADSVKRVYNWQEIYDYIAGFLDKE